VRIELFKARDGDCCLIRSAAGTNVMVDGGRATSYEDHVAARLGALRGNGERLHLLVVSHIDDDHISGVLRLLDHRMHWRVHHYQVGQGNHHHAAPSEAEPPEIDAIWHNGFSDLVGHNAGDIVDQLASSVSFHSLSPGSQAAAAALRQRIVLGEATALRLRARISPEQLDIDLNPQAEGRVLAIYQDQEAHEINDDLELTLIGPYFADVAALRNRWNDWLQDHQDRVEEIRREAREDEELLGLEGFGRWRFRMQKLATEIGTTGSLTAPNVASLMFLARDGGQTALMTGDGGHDVVYSGLENAGALRPDGSLHVDVLKVPHHGSEHNTSVPFTRAVTADHYLFCANGAHSNPDLEVLEAFLSSRLGPASSTNPEEARSTNPEAGNPFTFWFTYGPEASLTTNQRGHMTTVRDLVTDQAAASNGRLTVNFLEADYAEIALP